MTGRWTDLETADALLHVRAGAPRRWDIRLDRTWPVALRPARRRYARQIRQDLWRAAQRIRGFVPMVAVGWSDGTVKITAGGALCAGPAPKLIDHLAGVLDDPANRKRWDAHARGRMRK